MTKFGTAVSNMNVKEGNICRLCLKAPQNDFQMIDEITKEIFEVLLLRVNLDLSKNPIVCKSCVEVAIKCFNFKSVCIDTEEILFCVSIDKNRSMSTFELKEVYKERNYIEVVDDNFIICRFCLNHSSESNFVLLDTLMNDVMFAKMTQVLMPEMDFNIIKNSLICTSCKQNLECYVKFVENCSNVEEKITKYMQNEGTPSSAQVILDEVQMHAIKPEDVLENLNEALSEVYDDDLIKAEELDIKDEEDNFNETTCETSLDKPVLCESISQFGKSWETSTQISSIAPTTADYRICVCNTTDNCCIKISSEIEMGKACHMKYKDKINKKMNQMLTNNDNLFNCTLCTYWTRRKADLKKHMLIHKDITEVVIFKCSVCTFQAKQKSSLKTHMLIHKDITEVEMYKCSMCTYKTKHRSYLKKHMLIHKDITEVEKYKCSMCTLKTRRKADLINHMLIHKDVTEVEMYKCSMCTYKTKHRSYLKKHMLIHKDITEVEMYKCSKCTFQTKHKQGLKNHMLIHKDISEVEMYNCSICTFKTRHKCVLKKHISIHKDITEVEMYNCSICTYKTRHKWVLKRHISIHKDIKDVTEVEMYKCSMCIVETRRKDDLKKHMVIHKDITEVEMFKCSMCTFMTKHKRYLKKHILIHKDFTEVETYKCAMCTYESKHKSYLKKHILIHKDITEKEMYKCSKCTFQTKHKQGLKNHMLIHKDITEAENL